MSIVCYSHNRGQSLGNGLTIISAKNAPNKNNGSTGWLRGIRTPSKQQQQPVPQKQQQQQHPVLGMQQLPHPPPHCQASQLRGCLQ